MSERFSTLLRRLLRFLLVPAALALLPPPAGGGLTAEAPGTPATAYLPNPLGPPRPERDPRILRSPVLFALPSPLGFSRKILREPFRVPLTFIQPAESAALLPLTLSALDADVPLHLSDLMVFSPRSAPPPLPEVGAPLPVAPPAPPQPTLRLSSALQQRLFEPAKPPATLQPAGSEPLFLRAVLYLDPDGTVHAVFFEKPPPAPLEIPLLAYLRQLRFRPADAAAVGSVELFLPPRTDAAPAAASDAAETKGGRR